MNRGLADRQVCTEHSDRELRLDRAGERHGMWGIQRDGPQMRSSLRMAHGCRRTPQ